MAQKKFDRLQQAIKISSIWSTIFCAIVGITIAIFSMSLVSQFTKADIEMINVGKKRNHICSAGSRYPFSNNHHLYGSTASPGIRLR